MCNVQYNTILSDSFLCFKKSSAHTVQPDEMYNTGVFVNHYQEM